MRILYFHGWGSKFDPLSQKIQELCKIGSVSGPDLDYTLPFADVMKHALSWVRQVDPDVIVGTSLGGYLASHVAPVASVPFAAINPAINPCESLKRYLGSGTDFTGKHYDLQECVIRDLLPFSLDGFGLVLLDRGDELIPTNATEEYIGDRYPVVTFDGGSHRFEHMAQSLGYIQTLANQAQVAYD